MTPRAYYNEVDAYAAQWLRNLIAAGLITAGDVDTRSIIDVQPSDLRSYTRCHFFAGIGVWDYALGLAGWPADRPVWTGSCPCQPFSTAGRRGGTADERHLWPAWYHLICECGPTEILGEQVASRDGLDWLDLVHADLDGLGYAFGAADLCAAGVGAPHIRQRLWFVAHADRQRREQHPRLRPNARGRISAAHPEAAGCSEIGALANSAGERQHRAELRGTTGATALRGAEAGDRRATGLLESAGRGTARGVDDAIGLRQPAGGYNHAGHVGLIPGATEPARKLGNPYNVGLEGRLGGELPVPSSRTVQPPGRSGRDPWANADWLPCRDGKARPVEPGSFPLAHGAPARVGRLRAYGNAIVAPVAAAFIAACLDVLPSTLHAE